jgi:Cys-rich repeat protein
VRGSVFKRLRFTLLTLLLWSCGRAPLDLPPDAVPTPPQRQGREPAQHRSSSACVPVDLAAPRLNDCRSEDPPPPISGACSHDADCTAGRHGRCVQTHLGPCGCVYDACTSDADCPSGQACACNPVGFGNACVPASCRVDADCGDGGFCGPVIPGCTDQIVEYRCYASADQCLADSDCASGQRCRAYSGEPWRCHGLEICH